MVQRFMRGLIVVGLVFAGSTVNAYADLFDISDWFDECQLGKLLNIGMDTFVPDKGPLVGNQVEFGECSGEVDMAKFTMPEKSGSVRWAAGSTATSGKLMVDLQRRYAFDTNDNPDTIEFWTGKGDLWRWKKADKSEYFKAYYTLSSRIGTSNNITSLTIGMGGTAVAGTGSMTPASYSGLGIAPAGYTTLVNIHLEGYDENRYADWPGDGTVKIRYISKKIRGKSVVKDSSGQKSTVTVELGKVFTRSVPKNGKLHQHIVFRPLT